MCYLTNKDYRNGVPLVISQIFVGVILSFDVLYFDGCVDVRREFERNPGQMKANLGLILGSIKGN
jgi:hypothetical protein